MIRTIDSTRGRVKYSTTFVVIYKVFSWLNFLIWPQLTTLFLTHYIVE